MACKSRKLHKWYWVKVVFMLCMVCDSYKNASPAWGRCCNKNLSGSVFIERLSMKWIQSCICGTCWWLASDANVPQTEGWRCTLSCLAYLFDNSSKPLFPESDAKRFHLFSQRADANFDTSPWKCRRAREIETQKGREVEWESQSVSCFILGSVTDPGNAVFSEWGMCILVQATHKSFHDFGDLLVDG